MALTVVRDVKENFKVPHVIDVLMGHPTEEVLAHRHDELECFGCGDKHEARHWNAVLRQAMLSGYIYKEVENYGLLKLTKEGLRYIAHPTPFFISEDNEFDMGPADMDNADIPISEEGGAVKLPEEKRKIRAGSGRGLNPVPVRPDKGIRGYAAMNLGLG